MRKIASILLFVIGFIRVMAQPNYPTDYFRNPLDIPILLAGNFGECRPNHFHSGLDIKTNGKENLAVHAAADGYISRIKLESGGFGHAIYVTHPNGYTTLYAHLNDFMPDLQRYVKAEQYKKESWTIDMQFPPSQFPVKKGQQIAWSGNTGSSTAPHLHFEIRDNKTEHPLNPALFGLPIIDNIAPVPTKVAIYDAEQSLYQQIPVVASLKKKGNVYTTDSIETIAGQCGIGIAVNDFMNGSDNSLTFYTATIRLDSMLIGTITLDDIGYEETRYQHAYIDYKMKKTAGEYMQLMFQLKNNRLDHIYSWQDTKGTMNIADMKPHHIGITLTDVEGNETVISFMIQKIGVLVGEKCNPLFNANEENRHDNPNLRFVLNDKALYDDICFNYSSTPDASSYSDRYMIHRSYVPVHTYFDLFIKPNKAIQFNLKDKIALVYNDGKEETGKAAIIENGWYKTAVRNFGEYRLVADIQPPRIVPLQKTSSKLIKANRISFKITDDITSIKSYRAMLDGKWLCVEQHGDIFFYTFDEHCPKGKHILSLTATDENKNSQTLNYTFIR
ncbi:MAG: M23 family metallopeptidase [Bacteroidetes bacterium]|nr:M23 family metallopeptidase [Bacteroidota bacterium]